MDGSAMVMGDMEMSTELLVIGGGPGGFSAALRGAALGLDVCLVDPSHRPGEMGLLARSLYRVAGVLQAVQTGRDLGLEISSRQLDCNRIRERQQALVTAQATEMKRIAKEAGVLQITGRAVFVDPHCVRLENSDISRLRFQHCIIATGAQAIQFPPAIDLDHQAILEPKDALALPTIPKNLLVIGGGPTGLEIASIYSLLGSRVTLMEKQPRLLPVVDADLVEVHGKRIRQSLSGVLLNTEVQAIKPHGEVFDVRYLQQDRQRHASFERIIIAIGRGPQTADLGLDRAAVTTDSLGYIIIDDELRTTANHIFAVGDSTGPDHYAHRAIHQGRLAAEVIAGKPSAFDNAAIPAVIHTFPPIGWCGLGETEARREKIAYGIKKLPWHHHGWLPPDGNRQGMTKLLFDPETQRILGAGITGPDADEMIGEMVLAIEMGATLEDLALTMHPYASRASTLGATAALAVDIKADAGDPS